MLEDHLEKLRAFHLTSIEGSFLKASQKLGRSQPAVTKAVRLLEQHMKSTLFLRHARGVTLTPAGMLLDKFCESLFLRVRDLEKQIHSSEPLSGIVRIGTHETLGEVFFPQVLRVVGKEFPRLVIELTTENIEAHLSKLDSGALDIVVGLGAPAIERLHSRVLYIDYFGLFCKRDSPFLTSKERIPISYAKKAFDHLGINIEQHLGHFRQGFDLRYSVESFTTVRALVTEGVCVGVLPFSMAKNHLQEGLVCPFLPEKKFERFGDYKVCVTCVEDLKNDPRIAKISQILKTVAGKRA